MIAEMIQFSWQRSVFDETYFIHSSNGGGFKAKRVFEQIAPVLTGIHPL